MRKRLNWFFRVRRCGHGEPGFVAWCAKTPDLRDGPLEVDWNEEVHFEFGATEREAISRLKASLRAPQSVGSKKSENRR